MISKSTHIKNVFINSVQNSKKNTKKNAFLLELVVFNGIPKSKIFWKDEKMPATSNLFIIKPFVHSNKNVWFMFYFLITVHGLTYLWSNFINAMLWWQTVLKIRNRKEKDKTGAEKTQTFTKSEEGSGSMEKRASFAYRSHPSCSLCRNRGNGNNPKTIRWFLKVLD